MRSNQLSYTPLTSMKPRQASFGIKPPDLSPLATLTDFRKYRADFPPLSSDLTAIQVQLTMYELASFAEYMTIA